MPLLDAFLTDDVVLPVGPVVLPAVSDHHGHLQEQGPWRLGQGRWLAFVIILPFLGVFVHLIARGHKMTERDVAQAQEQDQAFRAYVQEARTRPAPLTSSPSWPTCAIAASSAKPTSSRARTRYARQPPDRSRRGCSSSTFLRKVEGPGWSAIDGAVARYVRPAARSADWAAFLSHGAPRLVPARRTLLLPIPARRPANLGGLPAGVRKAQAVRHPERSFTSLPTLSTRER